MCWTQIVFCMSIALTSSLSFAHAYLHDPKDYQITSLFYRYGETITAFRCKSSLQDPSPSQCDLKPPVVAKAKTVYKTMQERLSENLLNLESRIAALGARINVLDAKIDEIINSVEDSETSQSVEQALQQIEKTRTKLLESTLIESELRQTIDKVELALNQSADQDLLNQSLSLRSMLAKETQLKISREMDLTNARSNYIEQVSQIHSEAALKVIMAERANNTSTYLALKGSAKRELQALIQMNNFAGKLVDDQSFTYIIDANQLGSDAFPFVDAWRFLGYVKDSSDR